MGFQAWELVKALSPIKTILSTTAGQELFPRHYSWFAELLINSLREEQGTDALRERLEGMGKAVGRQVAGRLAGVKDKRERIRSLADIMRELGYQRGRSVRKRNGRLSRRPIVFFILSPKAIRKSATSI